ncbi:MAG: hypothetical protein KKB20_12450 [Proteobacteria bacterium]|nr:hypothetical protein [Pseudomonadota bacterium]
MDVTDEILGEALKHFDEAGIASPVQEPGAVLVLGLATKPGQDLDEVYFDGSRMRFNGWRTHVKPRIEAVLAAMADRGLEASAAGWWGYPMSLDIEPGTELMHLKGLAVTAGLGRQGRNTLVLHPRFGPWWRLAAIRTEAPLRSTGPGRYDRSEHPACRDCRACIEACPTGCLESYRLPDRRRCRADVPDEPVRGLISWCDCCLAACPIGR